MDDLPGWEIWGCRLLLGGIAFWVGAVITAVLLIRLIPPDQLRKMNSAIYIVAAGAVLVGSLGSLCGDTLARRLGNYSIAELLPVAAALGYCIAAFNAALLFYLILFSLIP